MFGDYIVPRKCRHCLHSFLVHALEQHVLVSIFFYTSLIHIAMCIRIFLFSVKKNLHFSYPHLDVCFTYKELL